VLKGKKDWRAGHRECPGPKNEEAPRRKLGGGWGEEKNADNEKKNPKRGWGGAFWVTGISLFGHHPPSAQKEMKGHLQKNGRVDEGTPVGPFGARGRKCFFKGGGKGAGVRRGRGTSTNQRGTVD